MQSLKLVHIRSLSGPADAHTLLLVRLGDLVIEVSEMVSDYPS